MQIQAEIIRRVSKGTRKGTGLSKKLKEELGIIEEKPQCKWWDNEVDGSMPVKVHRPWGHLGFKKHMYCFHQNLLLQTRW